MQSSVETLTVTIATVLLLTFCKMPKLLHNSSASNKLFLQDPSIIKEVCRICELLRNLHAPYINLTYPGLLLDCYCCCWFIEDVCMWAHLVLFSSAGTRIAAALPIHVLLWGLHPTEGCARVSPLVYQTGDRKEHFQTMRRIGGSTACKFCGMPLGQRKFAGGPIAIENEKFARFKKYFRTRYCKRPKIII